MDYGKIVETVRQMQKGYQRLVDYEKLRALIKYAMKSGDRHTWQMTIAGDEIELLALIEDDAPVISEEVGISTSGIYLTYHAIDRALERHYPRYLRETGRRISFCDWLSSRARHAYDNGDTGYLGRHYWCGISFAFEKTQDRGLVLKTVI